MFTCTTSGVTKHLLTEVINDWALSIGRMLPHDGTPGPVVISLPHGPQFLAAITGTWASGNAIAPLSLRATPLEIQKFLNTLRPLRIACETGDPRFEAVDSTLEIVSRQRGIKILATPQPESSLLKEGDALLATTSGTTGDPKCAVLSASAVLANCLNVRNYLELTKTDRILVFTPTHFTYATVQMLSAVLANATVLSGSHGLLSPPSLTAFAREYGITGVSANPTSYEMWLPSLSQQLDQARYVLCAGQPFRKRLFDKLTAAFPSAVQISGYGCTENVNRISFAKITSPGAFRNSIASVGWPIPGTTVSIKPDTSEIVLGGSSLMEGYLADLGAGLERIKNYNTGDLGVLGEAGDLYLTGRRTTRMNVGNEMVDPEEVEAAILLVPSATECAVGPLPDDLLGDAIGALIVFDDKPSSENIKTQIRSTLAGVLRRSRWPHHIDVVGSNEIPRTSYGKVDRKELKRRLEETFGPIGDPKRKATKL
jgi:acyl-CoA synthetase (AMP-forming)/AMP-acid ligase II